ncbi:unnamed protein product, partial [Rotaria sordida]
MPPPSLNIFDKLQLHAKEVKSDNNQLKSLRKQWTNRLRKMKIDLTTLMREAKIVKIEKARKEYKKLVNKFLKQLREPYDTIRHMPNDEDILEALRCSIGLVSLVYICRLYIKLSTFRSTILPSTARTQLIKQAVNDRYGSNHTTEDIIM